MTQVNYNDGLWHGWNGGECPVHPDTLVEAVLISGTRRPINAAMLDWSGPDVLPASHIIAFRVIKEHREPREWWIGYGDVAWVSRDIAVQSFGKSGGNPVHVREVLE